jgi:fermentation-respiration switch protein FrsA (DUF1100 family)
MYHAFFFTLVLGVIVFISIFVVFLSVSGQDKLFKPSAKVFHTTNEKYLEFDVAGINGRYFNNYPGEKTILYCHGNNDNITDREYIIQICKIYHLNLVLFDYNGFGKSKGKPSQLLLNASAEKVYDYLVTLISPKDIILWGESLGGSPAIHLAKNKSACLLVLLSTFSSIPKTLTDYKVFIWSVGSYLNNIIFDPLDNEEKIKDITIPIIIIHSKEDELVPYVGAVRLYNKINHENKTLFTITGSHGEPDTTLLDEIMIKIKSCI